MHIKEPGMFFKTNHPKSILRLNLQVTYILYYIKLKINKSFDQTFSKGGRRPQPMRVPEIQSQTGLAKKLVFLASFHRVLIKVPGQIDIIKTKRMA